MKKIFLALMLVLFIPIFAWGADVSPTQIQNILMWDIAGVIATTANSDVMAEGSRCTGQYSAFIKASGTVSITAAFHILDESGGNDVTVVTYSLTSATTKGYTWSFPTPRMYIVFTITTGQIDDVKVYCEGR